MATRCLRLKNILLFPAIMALGLTACGGGGVNIPPQVAVPSLSSGKIKHVVLIIQENRSLDNLFMGFPGLDTVTSGQTSTGQTVQLVPIPLEGVDANARDIAHMHGDFITAYNGGGMNGFDLEGSPPEQPNRPPLPLYPYAYVPLSEAQPYWTLAHQYAIGDRTFGTNAGGSFNAHQFSISGTGGGPESAVNLPDFPLGKYRSGHSVYPLGLRRRRPRPWSGPIFPQCLRR